MHILQVANVGRIVGGTAACAGTLTRSLPECEHTVAFLSRPTADTRAAFSHCRILHWPRVDASRVARIGADVVVLHNTSRGRADARLPVLSIQYVHSRITPTAADARVYCSRWLAESYGAGASDVLYQAVPRPPRPVGFRESRALRDEPVIGRICTPQRKKWPDEVDEFYGELARRFPLVRWEFVGCPDVLQPRLKDACGGRAAFVAASLAARERLWTWDAMVYHCPRVVESFGRTVAEAMRAGCVPIVDDAGGFREQIAEGCGCLCGSFEDFANALERLHDPGVRVRTSRAARAHADERFSPRRFGREFLRRVNCAEHGG